MRKTNGEVVNELYKKYKDKKGGWKKIEPELDDIISALVYSSQPADEVIDTDILRIFWNMFSGMVKDSEKEIRENKLNIKQAYEFIREDFKEEAIAHHDEGNNLVSEDTINNVSDSDMQEELEILNESFKENISEIKKEIAKKKN